jgi:hypothetical protein
MARCKIWPAIAGFGFADTASVKSGALNIDGAVGTKLGIVVGLAIGAITDVEVAAKVGIDVSTLVGDPNTAVGEPFVGGVPVCASAPLTAMSNPKKTTRNGTARSM